MVKTIVFRMSCPEEDKSENIEETKEINKDIENSKEVSIEDDNK